MKADVEAALAAAKRAGARLFIHTYAQVGPESVDPSDVTVGEKGLIGRTGWFVPFRQIASIFPVEPAARGRKKEKA